MLKDNLGECIRLGMTIIRTNNNKFILETRTDKLRQYSYDTIEEVFKHILIFLK